MQVSCQHHQALQPSGMVNGAQAIYAAAGVCVARGSQVADEVE